MRQSNRNPKISRFYLLRIMMSLVDLVFCLPEAAPDRSLRAAEAIAEKRVIFLKAF